MTTLDGQHLLAPEKSFLRFFQQPLLTAFLYFLGVEAAFLIDTVSHRIFSPLWPTTSILMCALLAAPTRHWWLHLLFVFPAHALAGARAGINLSEMLIAFAANCALGTATAAAVRYRIKGAPLGTLKNTSLYIVIAVITIAAAVALLGAFVRVAGGENIQQYWRFWAEWYVSNAFGYLTLAPALLVWLTHYPLSFRLQPKRRLAEAILLGSSLFAACNFAFALDPRTIVEGLVPSIIYLPVPLIILAALRFGNQGASIAILLVTLNLLWHSLGEGGLFASHSSATAVFSLQTFLIGLSTLMLLLGASVDDTRNAARIAREIEERMTFAAMSAHTGLWEYNIDENRFWATDFCRDLFGLSSKNKITAKTLIATVYPDDRNAAAAALRVDDPLREPGQSEFRVSLPGGATRWIRAQARIYRDEKGKPLRVGGIFSDVTHYKLSELESEQRRRDLVHLTRVSILGEMSGAIAHEINQPLTAILANAQAARMMLAQSPPKVSEAIEAIDDIVSEDTRAGQVISRIRGLLKKGEIKCERVQFNEIIGQTIKLLHGEFVSKHVDLKVQLEKNLPTIYGDPVQLEQVILNVIMNAMEAMGATLPARRLVTIRTSMTQSGWVEARISDCGPGIAPEHKNLLQEPFFTTKVSGLGLGLSICTTIMKSHGGDLQISNGAHGGAEVLLTLPIRLPHTATAENEHAAPNRVHRR